MKMMRVVAVVAVLGACSDPVAEPVNIRVCNLTGSAIAMITASEFRDRNLAIDQCTEYVAAKRRAYRYTYARFRIGIEDFIAQPIDFVGEIPLEPGYWSYELKIVDRARHYASADVVED